MSAVPGTTRDRLEVHLDVEGYPVTLIDTAGLRETADEVESIGVGRAREAAQAADLVLWLVAAGDEGEAPPPATCKVQLLRTKADLLDSIPIRSDGLSLSVLTGEGMEALWSCLGDAARSALEGSETALVTRARHRDELGEVAGHLRRAIAFGPDGAVELLAEDIRLAVRGIGRLTGRVDADEIYDVIFRDFCIGK